MTTSRAGGILRIQGESRKIAAEDENNKDWEIRVAALRIDSAVRGCGGVSKGGILSDAFNPLCSPEGCSLEVRIKQNHRKLKRNRQLLEWFCEWEAEQADFFSHGWIPPISFSGGFKSAALNHEHPPRPPTPAPLPRICAPIVQEKMNERELFTPRISRSSFTEAIHKMIVHIPRSRAP